jgi:hypothetical protein
MESMKGRMFPVHFINDVHFPSGGKGRKGDVTFQFPDFLDPVVRSAVDFDNVKAFSSGNGDTARALAAGLVAVLQVFTVQGLGEQPRKRSLAASPGTGKKIGVPHLVSLEGLFQDVHGHVLPGNLLKGPGPVPSVKRNRHRASSSIRENHGAAA